MEKLGIKVKNCNLGKKLLRGEMAIGKIERESIWLEMKRDYGSPF